MRKISSLLLATTLLSSFAATPVLAQGYWHGDIHHFHEYDYDHWRGGGWYHGFHDGRDGWWWTVGGGWYYYPAPVYPYPDPYTPPTVLVEPIPATPMGVPPSSVYYCPNPAGYYPYVPGCYGAWQRVDAAAPQPAPPVPSQPPQLVIGGSQRETDDRQLNAYAVEFQNITPDSHHAHSRLKALEENVEAFRQTLYSRGYNAMDILHDAESLEHRIHAERESLGHNATVTEQPAVTAPLPPPPSSAPPP